MISEKMSVKIVIIDSFMAQGMDLVTVRVLYYEYVLLYLSVSINQSAKVLQCDKSKSLLIKKSRK